MVGSPEAAVLQAGRDETRPTGIMGRRRCPQAKQQRHPQNQTSGAAVGRSRGNSGTGGATDCKPRADMFNIDGVFTNSWRADTEPAMYQSCKAEKRSYFELPILGEDFFFKTREIINIVASSYECAVT